MTPQTILTDIVAHLQSGKRVYITTRFKIARFDDRHVDNFKATDTALWLKQGKNWSCIATQSEILLPIKFEA